MNRPRSSGATTRRDAGRAGYILPVPPDNINLFSRKGTSELITPDENPAGPHPARKTPSPLAESATSPPYTAEGGPSPFTPVEAETSAPPSAETGPSPPPTAEAGSSSPPPTETGTSPLPPTETGPSRPPVSDKYPQLPLCRGAADLPFLHLGGGHSTRRFFSPTKLFQMDMFL